MISIHLVSILHEAARFSGYANEQSEPLRDYRHAYLQNLPPALPIIDAGNALRKDPLPYILRRAFSRPLLVVKGRNHDR